MGQMAREVGLDGNWIGLGLEMLTHTHTHTYVELLGCWADVSLMGQSIFGSLRASAGENDPRPRPASRAGKLSF
jgi:hypothetical protein